jgi:hypothetical protein
MTTTASSAVTKVVTTVPKRPLTDKLVLFSRDRMNSPVGLLRNRSCTCSAPAHTVHHLGEFRGKLGAENPAAKGDESQHNQTGNQEIGPDRQRRPALKRLGNDVQENRNQDRREADDQNPAELPEQQGTRATPTANAA